MTELRSDIVVVGGGFVGQAFAIAASRHDCNVVLYDRKPRPVGPENLSANVIAVNPASAVFLKDLGVWPLIPAVSMTPYYGMEVFDGTGTGSISFSCEEAGLAELGHIVDQSALLVALADAAEKCPNLEMRWSTGLEADLPEVDLLVGADGAHSKIREALGIRKLGFSYDQTATVCVAQLSEPHEGIARQWFHESGPVALLPLSAPDRVAVIWSSFNPRTDLAEDQFCQALEVATEGRQGEVIECGPRFSFPLMQQHALHYVQQGVALLGDAAHTIHPLAGQGANLGFADAKVLAAEIAAGRLEGRLPGDLSVLKRFEKSRKPEVHLVALAMEGFHRMFTSRLPIVELLRNRGLRLFDKNKSLKRLAISVATGRV
jgi:2-octaprenylphenol hydroxylase